MKLMRMGLGTIGGMVAVGPLAIAAVAATLTPSDRALIRDLVAAQMKDAGSAQFDFSQPRREHTVYCGRVNAKNSFGGYAGFQPFMILFNAPKDASKAVALVGDGGVLSDTLRSQCAEHGYRLP